MNRKKRSRIYNVFDKFSNRVTKTTGSPLAFLVALSVIIAWAVTGPIFHFSDTWQLIINTGTTIVTFLMVFIIQQSQNKDTVALHLKLNELIAASKNASNRLIDSEDLTEQELQAIKKYYVRLSELAQKENDLYSSHSIDEAHKDHIEKKIEQSEDDKKRDERIAQNKSDKKQQG